MTVSIVTQTSVRPERSEDFARWQGETSNMVSSFPGFVEQRLMPPNPPLQVDWVILQRFHTMEAAQRWLASTERQTRIEGAAPSKRFCRSVDESQARAVSIFSKRCRMTQST